MHHDKIKYVCLLMNCDVLGYFCRDCKPHLPPPNFCCLISGFYLISPSEFERFSLSTRHVVEPRSLVEVPLYSASSDLRSSQPDGVTRYPHCGILDFPLGTAHLRSNLLCL